MNQKAYYGEFGGQYVAESLMNTLEELDKAFEEAIHDPEFMEQYHYYLKQYVGRETPLYFAERLSEKYGTKIYLKREDLNHTGKDSGRYLLYHRFCGRSISLSKDGQGISERDQQRSKKTVLRSGTQAAGCRDGMRGRRLELHWNVCRFYRGTFGKTDRR